MNRWKWALLAIVASIVCLACAALKDDDVKLLQDQRAALRTGYLEADGGMIQKVIAKGSYCAVNQVLKDIGKDDAGESDAGVIACPDGGK